MFVKINNKLTVYYRDFQFRYLNLCPLIMLIITLSQMRRMTDQLPFTSPPSVSYTGRTLKRFIDLKIHKVPDTLLPDLTLVIHVGFKKRWVILPLIFINIQK